MRRIAELPSGVIRLYRVDEAGVREPAPCAVAWNSWMDTWGYLACKGLGQGDMGYAINAAYVEYANVANPADAAAIPSFLTSDGRSYFDGLAATPDRDYLRIPLRVTPAIGVAPGFEASFGPGQGNVLTVYGQTAGTVGANGKPFSAAANSKVCGVALVAAPVLADRTRDVLFSRGYYAAPKQQLKAPNGQFGFEYDLTFVIEAAP